MKKFTVFLLLGLSFSATSAFALSGSDTLKRWNNASYSQQSSLCSAMTNKISSRKVTPTSLCSCISEIASSGENSYMSIGEAAASCAVIMRN